MSPRRHPHRKAHTSPRRLAAAVVGTAVVAGTVLTGCSKGKDGAAASTSTPTTRPGASSTVPVTPPTVDDDGYSKFVAVTLDKINKAGTNPCKVAVVFRDIGIGPQPTTPQQGQQAVDLVVRLFESVAGAAGPAGAADAKLLTDGAARISKAAKANDYSPSWITQNANETLGGEGLAALQRLVAANDKNCRADGGSPATTAG